MKKLLLLVVGLCVLQSFNLLADRAICRPRDAGCRTITNDHGCDPECTTVCDRLRKTLGTFECNTTTYDCQVDAPNPIPFCVRNDFSYVCVGQEAIRSK
jgi:hypothetical protein